MRRLMVALLVLTNVLATGSRALAEPGDLTLASTSDTGIKGNGTSIHASSSIDGTRVAFVSYATNLDPADTDSMPDVYVKDLLTGDITLASTSDTGTKGNGESVEPSLSADGTTVAFYSLATNLDPADTDSIPDVYVKDLLTGDITLASTSDSGVKGNASSASPSLSAEGTAVAFYSGATNLDLADTDFSADIYVKDLLNGEITLASASNTGIKGNDYSYQPSLSADGRAVAFHSYATNLDPADTDATSDIYVKDLPSGDIILASTSDAGNKGNELSSGPDLSADGTAVAFFSYATNLDPADTDSIPDVYVKDLLTGDITLASTSDTGVKGNEDSLYPSLSADGTKVAFLFSGTNLDPVDTDLIGDVYVKDLLTDDIIVSSTSDAGIKGNGDSIPGSLSADGTAVAFWSNATNLDPSDTDIVNDVYVKELGGAPALEADVGVGIVDKPDPVVMGRPLAYRMTITNQGPDVAARVTLTDTFPGGTRFVSVSASQGSCTVQIKERTVTCELGSLADDASATVTLTLRLTKIGTITNTALVDALQPDPNPANNSDSETTSVLAG